MHSSCRYQKLLSFFKEKNSCSGVPILRGTSQTCPSLSPGGSDSSRHPLKHLSRAESIYAGYRLRQILHDLYVTKKSRLSSNLPRSLRQELSVFLGGHSILSIKPTKTTIYIPPNIKVPDLLETSSIGNQESDQPSNEVKNCPTDGAETLTEPSSDRRNCDSDSRNSGNNVDTDCNSNDSINNSGSSMHCDMRKITRECQPSKAMTVVVTAEVGDEQSTKTSFRHIPVSSTRHVQPYSDDWGPCVQKLDFVCNKDSVSFPTVALGCVNDLRSVFRGKARAAGKAGTAKKGRRKTGIGTDDRRMLLLEKDVAEDLNASINLCVSSQAGCAMKCGFCASGRNGLIRDLDVDEITDQILYFESKGYKIDSLSFTGMGEPLANPRVFNALTVITGDMKMSQRRINISTVGVVPGIRQLNDQFPQVNLGLSLHSPFNDQRAELVPINSEFGLTEVFRALDDRLIITGRQVFLHYILFSGTNDTIEHAQGLVDLIKYSNKRTRHLYHVQLQPYNTVYGVSDRFTRSTVTAVSEFERVLMRAGVSCSHG
eukprot:GHVQ01024250.1.p1 GENE.GHVQ01024250.1~~GHVQ01024250.1.p1  ORF type:complete len:542 (+),score=51.99 GHVQ01024250.1:412-2037(+)